VLRLIRRYLEAGVMANGVVVERQEGTPQGGPLSPLLANVLLDEVDKELERRGHAFIRYADDCAPRKRGGRQQPTESSAAQEMRDGPSDSDGRVRVQTTGSRFGPMVEVVSVLGKRRDETRQVSAGKTNVSEPLKTCRKRRDVIETRLQSLAWEEPGGWPAYWPGDGRHKDGVSPAQALVWNVGTSRSDAKGELQAVDPRGAEYRSGAKGRMGSW